MGAVTTSRKPSEKRALWARQLAENYNIPYVERKNHSLETLLDSYPWVLVADSRRLCCHTPDGVLFFHPNMAAVRLRHLKANQPDKMLKAMGLGPGQKVLDCTAGFCSDSLVAAWAVGEKGTVVALEQSLPVFLVVKDGLEQAGKEGRFAPLAAQIELKHADFRQFLVQTAAKSFDVVYFDPMFDVPAHSASMVPLRPLACHIQLTAKDIEAAARVARRRVVVKQRSFYPFSRLGLDDVLDSGSSPITYGMLDLEGGR